MTFQIINLSSIPIIIVFLIIPTVNLFVYYLPIYQSLHSLNCVFHKIMWLIIWSHHFHIYLFGHTVLRLDRPSLQVTINSIVLSYFGGFLHFLSLFAHLYCLIGLILGISSYTYLSLYLCVCAIKLCNV